MIKKIEVGGGVGDWEGRKLPQLIKVGVEAIWKGKKGDWRIL